MRFKEFLVLKEFSVLKQIQRRDPVGCCRKKVVGQQFCRLYSDLVLIRFQPRTAHYNVKGVYKARVWIVEAWWKHNVMSLFIFLALLPSGRRRYMLWKAKNGNMLHEFNVVSAILALSFCSKQSILLLGVSFTHLLLLK